MKTADKYKRGVTLTEMVIAVAILGTVFMMSKIGIDIMNGFARQRGLVDAQRQAQLTLYLISKDVRNARAVLEASPTTHRLRMQMFDVGLGGYDVNTNVNLFNPLAVTTVTYQYAQIGQDTCMLRTVDAPGTARDNQLVLAKNILVAPTDPSIFFFQPGVNDDPSTPPYSTVQISLRLDLPYEKEHRKIYQTTVQKRGLMR